MKKTQKGIWETDAKKLDFNKPRVLRWYIERKVNVGDWSALDRKTLAKALPEIKIDPQVRGILYRFLNGRKPSRG